LSKVAITGNASGTGTFTLAAPDSNSDRTLTLPDNTGTILTNATTAGFPAGSVIQVVQDVDTAASIETTSTSFVSTGTSATITPSSTANKILIMCSACLDEDGGSPIVTIFRGATNIVPSGTEHLGFAFVDEVAGDRLLTQLSWFFLDSPNSTSSLTYEIRFRSRVSATSRYRTDLIPATITLMEIAA